jgi:hypothetical protein
MNESKQVAQEKSTVCDQNCLLSLWRDPAFCQKPHREGLVNKISIEKGFWG